MNITYNHLRIISAAFLGFVAFGLPRAHADDRDGGELDHGDRKFLLKTAEGSTNEVALSRVALERSGDSRVRDLAQMMIRDHEALNMKVRDLARRKGVDISDAVRKGREDDVESLRHKSPSDFDETYLGDMLSGHRDTIDLFEKTALESRDGDISSLASDTLPTLFQHYRHVRRLVRREDRDHPAFPGVAAPLPPQ